MDQLTLEIFQHLDLTQSYLIKQTTYGQQEVVVDITTIPLLVQGGGQVVVAEVLVATVVLAVPAGKAQQLTDTVQMQHLTTVVTAGQQYLLFLQMPEVSVAGKHITLHR
jgi:hypothetical protein